MFTVLPRRIFGNLLTGLLLLSAVQVRAGTADTWYMRSWQSADGLPDNNVCGVAQTPDGFLWVATAGGLMRFDGVRFQEFPLADLDGVPNRVVRDMLMDRRGRLWLNMDRGPVVCIAPDGAQVFTNGLSDMRATYMVDDASGAVWITYVDGSLVRIKNGQTTVFGVAEGWPASGASSLATDNKGRLWFSKGDQIGIFEDGKFRTLLHRTVWCIGRRREGGIWIGAGHQLFSFDGDGKNGKPRLFEKLPAGRNEVAETAIFEDRSGGLWIGTAASGLFYCDGTNATQMPTSYHDITCVTQDGEGNLWVGTAGGGLDRLRPRIIELLGTATGLPYESVRSICEDTTGAIWVVAQSGRVGKVACWQNGLWKTLPAGTNEPDGDFTCVAADLKTGIWIGTRDNGLFHLQNGNCQNWRRQDGLASDNIRCVFQNSDGDVFATTDNPNQLQMLHDGKWQKLPLPVQTHSLRAMVEDASGKIWVASADGYLFCVESNTVINKTPNTNGLLSIRCLSATPDGSLWIGYAGWGIGWLKDGQSKRITSEQGLYDDYISQIVADNQGRLWCAGNRGIFELPLEQLREAMQDQRRWVRCIAYSSGEGFPNLQANYDNSPGAMRSRDGRMWFPMRTGLAVVYPNSVPAGPAPPVLLERMTVDGKVIKLYNKYIPPDSSSRQLNGKRPIFRLPPTMRKLDFQFTALGFTAPENIQFQYRLRGLDDDWTENGTTRSVSYSRLPPGNYHFEVRACSSAGVWSQSSASVGFVVLPFYWQTWWFHLSVLVAFTLSIVAVVRFVSFQRLHRRMRLLEQQAALQKERARIAKDIHDDLGADLTQIAYLGELAGQDYGEREKSGERIARISETARLAIKSLDEIVWAVNPRNDTLSHLIDYAGQFALDYLRTAGIRCRLDFPETISAREFSTELRHNFFLVVKEALHNIVKHARASEVKLTILLDDQALDMVIEDNGCGFEREPDDAFADGLRNMRQRMNEIGGEFHFESRPRGGTRVALHLPLRSERAKEI